MGINEIDSVCVASVAGAAAGNGRNVANFPLHKQVVGEEPSNMENDDDML